MSRIPHTVNRTLLDKELEAFLKFNPDLQLGSDIDFHKKDKKASIDKVEETFVRGPHGSIPVRLFYPKAVVDSKHTDTASLVYMHGGGHTVGSVDEFENGLRIIAEEAGVITTGADYCLAPEHEFPTQFDEYEALVAWAQSSEVFGGGDSAGGNLTAAVALRFRDEGKKNIAGQFLLYPEARVPFDTPTGVENISGYYLECNGISSFADHYLPRAPEQAYPASHHYVNPGMQGVEYLKNIPNTAVCTFGFNLLRDFGVEYASKLDEADNEVTWITFLTWRITVSTSKPRYHISHPQELSSQSTTEHGIQAIPSALAYLSRVSAG